MALLLPGLDRAGVQPQSSAWPGSLAPAGSPPLVSWLDGAYTCLPDLACTVRAVTERTPCGVHWAAICGLPAACGFCCHHQQANCV